MANIYDLRDYTQGTFIESTRNFETARMKARKLASDGQRRVFFTDIHSTMFMFWPDGKEEVITMRDLRAERAKYTSNPLSR